MNSRNEIFHSSIEGAQHGPKGLMGFWEFASKAGAGGAQPSNFMLQKKDGSLMTAEDLRPFVEGQLRFDGVSAHCPFWVHTSAWTGSPTIRPFIPESVAQLPPEKIEQWAEDYILRLLDLCAEIKVKIVPMFWGVALGWEAASGYPWGLWSGPGYDLVFDGVRRFADKTRKIRQHANELGIKLCHEIHPGTAAQCAYDFLQLVEICDGDECLTVNVDPSHCWDGEDWETRFRMPGIAERVYGCHVKNHIIVNAMPLRSLQPDWQKRGMYFCPLPVGDIDLSRFVEVMIEIGYPQRYCKIMGTDTAPLVTEAESAFRDLDSTAVDAIEYVNDELIYPIATQSFEDGMGEKS